MLKSQLYPLIKNYFEEYLHGFTKKQLDIAITKGQIRLQYLNLRPDTINKKMDEKNVPFWIKAGLIRKINIGWSVMNIIGEVPLELRIDGLDIIINPSYKWILKNIDLYKQNILESQFFGDFINLNQKNPLDINLKRKIEDFDSSIFTHIKELFKDKTIISNIINKFYEKCYNFYLSKNTPMSIKLKNIHIRIEDDYLINYNGDLALGIKIDNIDIKLCKKGNMKKNSIKISKLDIYWENQAKILIPSSFFLSLFINGQLQESYYSQLQDIKFQNFNYQRNTKFIIDNFNLTMNFGTKIINYSKSLDIFNVKDKPLILYVQVSTSDLNINFWPELLLILNNFMSFTEKFKVIEKIKEFKPKIKPFMKDNNNENNNLSNNRKLLVRNWLYYFLFCQKMLKYHSTKNNNPLRVEFLRYYNIFCKKADISSNIEIEEENKDFNNIPNRNINTKKDLPIKLIINENNLENSKNYMDLKNEENNKTKSKSNFDFFGLGNNNLISNKTITSKNVVNINSFLNEQKRKQFEENTKLKQINLSFITDILIKSITINIHPSVQKENLNYLIFKINDISTKITLSKEKFDFNINTKAIDFGPYNLVYGERVILCQDSYRKLYQDPQLNSREYDLLKNYQGFIDTELIMDDINNEIINNPQNFLIQGNDALSFAEMNNKKRSRGSSFCSKSKNGLYNLDYSNNNISNNNIINQYMTKGANNRPLNTISNNYNTNINPLLNSRNNLLDNSIQNNNKKSFYRLTLPKKTDMTILDNLDESFSQIKLNKKQQNELDISQAVNNYNSYKLKKKRSTTPISSISPIKMRMNNNKNVNEPFNNKNIPLNLLEIYSNLNNNSFSLSFIKYNNPVSIDTFKIQLGTIRTNLFVNYISQSFKIFQEYTKIFKYETKNSFFETLLKENSMENNKQLFNMKNYFYKRISRLPDNEKTESMLKYGEYLRKEILIMRIFNTKAEDFNLNYLFSIFSNGIKTLFSFENLECVYYNNYNKISGKFIIPTNEFEVTITIKKIIVKILGMELEINDLEDTKLIINKIKKLFEDKLVMAGIVLEPYYSLLKKELDKNYVKKFTNKGDDNRQYNNIGISEINIRNNNNTANDNIMYSKNNIINTNDNNKIYIDNNLVLMNSRKADKEENKIYNNNDENNIKNNNFYVEEE